MFRRDVDFGVRDNVLAVGGRLVDLYTPTRAYKDLVLPLHGAYQGDNAALALMTAEAFLGVPLDPEVVESAFAGVRSPGRLEIVRRQPLVLLDGAHNVAGAEALAGRARRRVRHRPENARRRAPPREGSARDAAGAGHRRSRVARLLPAAQSGAPSIPSSSPTRRVT